MVRVRSRYESRLSLHSDSAFDPLHTASIIDAQVLTDNPIPRFPLMRARLRNYSIPLRLGTQSSLDTTVQCWGRSRAILQMLLIWVSDLPLEIFPCFKVCSRTSEVYMYFHGSFESDEAMKPPACCVPVQAQVYAFLIVLESLFAPFSALARFSVVFIARKCHEAR